MRLALFHGFEVLWFLGVWSLGVFGVLWIYNLRRRNVVNPLFG